MVEHSDQTEWTIGFLKCLQLIGCAMCLKIHIEGAFYEEEPMPHNILFCSTYGGFLILTFAGILVPFSGELSPPGVDLVFSSIGFSIFYICACVAMYYVYQDEHLQDMTDKEERKHPFFIICCNHAKASLITGTLFLMHAIISADRLQIVPTLPPVIGDHEELLDEEIIDIDPLEEIELHLFFFNWLIAFCNIPCCQKIKIFCGKCCKQIKKPLEKHLMKSAEKKRKKRLQRIKKRLSYRMSTIRDVEAAGGPSRPRTNQIETNIEETPMRKETKGDKKNLRFHV